MNFEEARAEYARLRQQFEYRQLAPDDFAHRVQALQVLDPRGIYWSIDGASGNWLRFDGARWVPDRPAVPSAYAPPQAGYAPAGTLVPPTPAPGLPSMPQSAPRGGVPRWLISALAALTTLLLGMVLVSGVALASGKVTFDASTGLMDPVVASGIGADNRPVAAASDFPLGAEVYITFTARRLRAGQSVTIRALRDGRPVPVEPTSNVIMARQSATYYGSFTYRPALPGAYQVGLFLGNATVPSQTLSFVVR